MITYGNSRTKMVGIIRKVQEKQFTIQFPQLDHEVLGPFSDDSFTSSRRSDPFPRNGN